ncbi:MAG: HNH endonuclease [Firmicutes bacterium]|nr:HNH endonuclease [Bacillota bacterium]
MFELEPELATLFEKVAGKGTTITIHSTGTFASWTIKDQKTAIKRCDKSFFDYRGSTLPRDIYWFFDVDELKAGDKRIITLEYDGEVYEAYLHREKHDLARVRLFWYQNLADEFAVYDDLDYYPNVIFHKDSVDSYEVEFDTEAPLSDKAIEVAEALLKLIANRRRTITYGELSNMTKSKPNSRFVMGVLLDEINRKCNELNLPAISAMVTNKNTGLPGDGFRGICVNVFGRDPKLSLEELFENELDEIGKCSSWYRLADYIGINMPEEDDDPLPEEIELSEDEPIIEGAKKTITVNSYERDPKAKQICKDHYMNKDGRIICQICGFDFGDEYGPEYSNMIEVHHIVPISKKEGPYTLDPINDLIPVCPNCHAVLHRGDGISVEDLREKVQNRRKK